MNWLVAVIQLTFGDVNNRLLVVKSLTASTGPGAWGLLNRAVRDRDARVRQAAITALGLKFGAKAIGILITALQHDENEDIRMKAADLLVQIGQEAVTPLINALIISQTIIDPALPAQTLVRIGGQQVVSSLFTLLEEREPIIDRALAAQVLGKIPQTVSFLTTLINDKSGRRRDAAIEALVAILQYIPDESIRMSATDLLVQMGQDAVLPLIEVLRSKDPSARADAADLVVRIGEDAVLPLIGVLRSDPSLRELAVHALVRIGGPLIVSSLMTVINDTSGTVRYAAIDSLVEILQFDKDKNIRLRAADVLVQTGQDAVLPLINASRSPTTTDPALAVQALGRIGGLQAVSSLAILINDARGPVRVAVAEALGLIAGRLKTGNAGQRLAAIKALEIIGGLEAVGSLVQTLEDEDPEVSWEAALVLERYPNRDTIMSRVLALEQTDGHIPGVAYLLAQYSDPDVIERLQKQVPAIVRHLDSKNPIQRLAAVKALDGIGGSEAIGALVEILNDPDDRVSYAIAKALARRGDSATIQAKLSEWEASDKGKNYKNNEAVNTLVAASAALNSNELRRYTEGKSEETHKNIRAQLEKQLNKLLDRYAPDTFGG